MEVPCLRNETTKRLTTSVWVVFSSKSSCRPATTQPPHGLLGSPDIQYPGPSLFSRDLLPAGYLGWPMLLRTQSRMKSRARFTEAEAVPRLLSKILHTDLSADPLVNTQNHGAHSGISPDASHQWPGPASRRGPWPSRAHSVRNLALCDRVTEESHAAD